MKIFETFIFGTLMISSYNISAYQSEPNDITTIISEEEFSTYQNVADFIEHSPKVSIVAKPDENDIAEYGKGVVKTLTGSDCDRDGIMDDNKKCNAVYYKLWMKYQR